MAILSSNPRKDSFDATLIATPSVTDILCGKDKTFAKHPGNQAFRDMILSYSNVYSKALTKQSKMQLTKEIVTTLQKTYNARFLQPSRCGQGWNEISDQVARDKTSHALRFAGKTAHHSGRAPSHKKRKPAAAAPVCAAKRLHRRQVSWNALDGGSMMAMSQRLPDRARSPSPLLTQSNSRFSQYYEDFEPVGWKPQPQRPGKAPEPHIFERQQIILKSLAVDDSMEPPPYQHHHHHYRHYAVAPVAMRRHEFDSLRSEDFESLLNDPLLLSAASGEIPDTWETVPL